MPTSQLSQAQEAAQAICHLEESEKYSFSKQPSSTCVIIPARWKEKNGQVNISFGDLSMAQW